MSKKIQALTFPTPTFYLRRQVLARFPFENRYSAMQFPKLSLARSSNCSTASDRSSTFASVDSLGSSKYVLQLPLASNTAAQALGSQPSKGGIAEMLDEDNLAWDRSPSKKSKRRSN
ncbi:hypothetical protein AcW1_000250 [Taiwanofungus camphoratus]|nr:hypothetical protein AcW1_000250 [Antrodia cinnamomea]